MAIKGLYDFKIEKQRSTLKWGCQWWYHDANGHLTGNKLVDKLGEFVGNDVT